jgi:predicted SnoaL-like aldol condensation-catalyzing enzyme
MADHLKINKAQALSFLELAAGGNAKEAFRRYAATGFKHHNVFFKGDPHTLMEAMDESAKENPGRIFTVKRAVAEGDLVAVHSHYRSHKSDPGHAVAHIFRFEYGKIAEFWDFAQAVPADSPNENGMF